MLSSRRLWAACALLIVICGSVARADTQANPPAQTQPAGSTDLPSMDQIMAMMHNRQYGAALVPLQKMMGMKDHDADAFNRHEVLMLVAECRLQLHRIAESLSVLNLATKEAEEDNNWPQRAEAVSLATVLRAAPRLLYAPKDGAEDAPLNLAYPDQRKIAYEKMSDEKRNFCTYQIRTAREGASLKPLLDSTSAFAASRALEQQATGSTTKADAVGDQLATWAQGLIDHTLKSFDDRIDEISNDSNVGVHGRKHRGKAGLTSDEKSELLTMAATCKKIPPAIDSLNNSFAEPLMTQSPEEIAHALNISTRAESIVDSDSKITRNRK